MRLLFWIVTGRFSNLLFSLNKGKRRASKQLAANYSQMEIEKQRKEKMERERAFVEGSAKSRQGAVATVTTRLTIITGLVKTLLVLIEKEDARL